MGIKLTGLVKLVPLAGRGLSRLLSELLPNGDRPGRCADLVKRMSAKDRRLVAKLCERMGDKPLEDVLSETLRQVLCALRNEIGRQSTPEPSPEPAPAPAPVPALDPAPDPPPEEGDDIPFSSLSWDYGGFDGHKASHVSGSVISSLKVGSSGMTYSWKSGGCEDLGASSSTDAKNTLACLFVKRGGVYRGGKFDWISTSRKSRDFKNISEGYQGWPKDAVSSGSEFAFCIVGKDGKRRTNVIACGK